MFSFHKLGECYLPDFRKKDGEDSFQRISATITNVFQLWDMS